MSVQPAPLGSFAVGRTGDLWLRGSGICSLRVMLWSIPVPGSVERRV
jgi:hypothetical protein